MKQNFPNNHSQRNVDSALTANPTARIKRLIFISSVLALLFALAAVIWLRMVITQQPLPVIATVSDFSLTERSGRQIGLNDLRGQIWIADFIFTNCAGICPIMTTAMAGLQSATVHQKLDDVMLVSISVDPARDTPAVLAKYAEKYHAEANRWYFLTGDSAAIQQLAQKGFRLMSAIAGGGSEEEPIIHSDRFVLVDRQARIRGYYRGTEKEEVEQLLRDLKKLYGEGAS
jgi:protein SCO1/2